MTKTKPELLEEANKLKLEVNDKNTAAEISEAIKKAKQEDKQKSEEIIAGREAVVAKSGKRSEKAAKEAEEKAAKEARKETGEVDADGVVTAKKGPKPVTRPKLERRGKKYRETAKLIDKSTVYSLAEALELAVKTSPSKFDATVEVHVRMGVDPRQADQNIRASVSLPNGTGKKITIAVFAPESDHSEAKKAGADIIGDDDFLKQLDKQEINFDILISTPQYIPKLGKYARLLGPKGLMPNPKSGTVAVNVAKAVTEAKAGKVEYRVDKQAIIHIGIGKVSFGASKLEQNARAFFDSLKSHKPSGLKGSYVKSTSICTSQGPSIKTENIVN